MSGYDVDPVQQTIGAARQLITAWKPNHNALLLNQRPPAVCCGKVQALVCKSLQLVTVVSTGLNTAAPEHEEQLVKAFIEDLHVPEQLAAVLAWLQRRHQLQEELTITSSSNSSSSSSSKDATSSTSSAKGSYANLWYACMRCLQALTTSAVRCEWSKRAPYAECLALALATGSAYTVDLGPLLHSCTV
jgi:hypothetical protein